MKRIVMLLMLVPAGLVAAGMQSTQAEKAGMPGMSMMMNCPMTLQETSVAVADTATGATVSITTKPENVAELRRRVEQMATMHSPDKASSAAPAMMQGQMMPGTVKYEVIENGARLTLTPKDPAKLAEFQKQVRTHVEKMQKGECSMMQDMMQGMMQGMMGGMGKPGAKPEPKPEPRQDETDHSAHHPEGK